MRTPTVRFTRILATAALAAGLGAAIPSGPAHATTLITGFDAADSYGLASFTENGFTITLGTANDPSAYGLVYPYTNFFLIGTDSATIVTITATDGGAFTFQGLSAFLYLGASDPADTLTAMRNGTTITTDSFAATTDTAAINGFGPGDGAGALTGVVMDTLVIGGLVSPDASLAIGFNSVLVTEVPTPEPASLLLFASGLAALGAARRRRRNRAA